MSLDDLMSIDAALLVDSSLMIDTETVVFVFPDNTTRTVNAIVDRNGLKDLSGGAGAMTPNIEITVRNHATLGILPTEIVANLRAQVSLRQDGTLQTFTVVRPSVDGRWRIDSAAMRLGLR